MITTHLLTRAVSNRGYPKAPCKSSSRWEKGEEKGPRKDQAITEKADFQLRMRTQDARIDEYTLAYPQNHPPLSVRGQ